jgi:outer membrane receptor protein involved in Fe transport
LSGWEFEARQQLGRLWESLEGLSLGLNATFIDATVRLSEDESAQFSGPGIEVPITTRDMTNAPNHLYNVFLTYDIAPTSTQLGLFYTIQGDTLVAGAGIADDNFVPSIYSKEYDTLNFTISQSFGKHFKLQAQAKNLTNPDIEEVYRSDVIGDDVTKSSYTKGIEFSLGFTVEFYL